MPERDETPEDETEDRPDDTRGELPEKSSVRIARFFNTGVNTERTIFFSDAVMAIAMTLLVLEITLPDSADVSVAELPSAILNDVTAFAAYALSFALIGINWITHHRKFTVIVRYDTRLQWINLGFLFFIAILPLPTRILSDYGPVTIAVVLYAAVVALTSVFQFWLWSHARRAGLFSEVVDDEMYRYSRRNMLALPIAFAFSIVVCLVIGPDIAMYSWFLMIPIMIFIGRYLPPAERRARRAQRAARGATSSQ